jgi:hypothetical protein
MAEHARFFTRARKIPILVGRLPDGQALPGGPYTLVQVLSGAGVGLVLSKTTEVWAHFGGLLDLVFAAGLVVAVIWGTGKLPNSGRNPFTWAMDAVSLYSTPRQGSLRGRALRVGRPHLVHHRLVVLQAKPAPEPSPEAAVSAPALADPPASTRPSAAAVPTGPAMSGVARLLAGAVTREDSHA